MLLADRNKLQRRMARDAAVEFDDVRVARSGDGDAKWLHGQVAETTFGGRGMFKGAASLTLGVRALVGKVLRAGILPFANACR